MVVKSLSVAAFIALVHGTAAAEDWRFLANSTEMRVSLQKSRIERLSPNEFRFWLRFNPLDGKPASIQRGDPKSPRFSEAKQYVRLLCNERRSSMLVMAFYDARGNVVQSRDGNEDQLSPIIPDSIMEAAHEAVCSWENTQHR